MFQEGKEPFRKKQEKYLHKIALEHTVLKKKEFLPENSTFPKTTVKIELGYCDIDQFWNQNRAFICEKNMFELWSELDVIDKLSNSKSLIFAKKDSSPIMEPINWILQWCIFFICLSY